jgi:hypothetical protein
MNPDPKHWFLCNGGKDKEKDLPPDAATVMILARLPRGSAGATVLLSAVRKRIINRQIMSNSQQRLHQSLKNGTGS